MEELDELCRERAKLLELKAIMTNTSLTSATEATAKVLRDGRINETEHKYVCEAIQKTTRWELRNITKAQKQADKKTEDRRVQKTPWRGTEVQPLLPQPMATMEATHPHKPARVKDKATE